MRFVVDTSILISSLIRQSVSREILLLPFMKFYLPQYALEEIEVHKPKISRLSGLSFDEIDILLNSLLEIFLSYLPKRFSLICKKRKT